MTAGLEHIKCGFILYNLNTGFSVKVFRTIQSATTEAIKQGHGTIIYEIKQRGIVNTTTTFISQRDNSSETPAYDDLERTYEG